MLDEIKSAFTQTVKGIDWMDEETKKDTLLKVKDMVSFVGYPEWLLNKTVIEVYYEDVSM